MSSGRMAAVIRSPSEWPEVSQASARPPALIPPSPAPASPATSAARKFMVPMKSATNTLAGSR